MRRSDGIERTRHAGSHEIEPGEGVRGVIAAVAGARVAARAATRASRISDPRLCATARLLARFRAGRRGGNGRVRGFIDLALSDQQVPGPTGDMRRVYV